MTWRVCWLTIWTEACETGAPVELSVTVPSNAPVTVSCAIAKGVVWPNQATTSIARSSNSGECDCRVKRITNLCDGDRISIWENYSTLTVASKFVFYYRRGAETLRKSWTVSQLSRRCQLEGYGH